MLSKNRAQQSCLILNYGGLPLASLHAAVFQFVAICIILLALAHWGLGEFDSHHCGARHAAVNRGIECMHMTRQKPLADGSQRLAFLGIIIHNRGRAELNSNVKLPSLGPTVGLHRLTAVRHTCGLARRMSSLRPSGAQWKYKVCSSVRANESGTA